MLILLAAGCDPLGTGGEAFNPFTDLPAIALDGRPKAVSADIVPLGDLKEDDVVRVRVEGEAVDAVLILTNDAAFAEAGVLAGGGPPNELFDYRAQVPGRYFVFVQFDPLATGTRRTATITAMPGDPAYRPPARQLIQIIFEEDYLTGPGLLDPVDGTQEDQAFLEEVADVVQDEIVGRLRTIFAGTPIEIIDESEMIGSEPVSRVTFRPDRELAEDQDAIDAALPAPDPDRPQCQFRVIFGEILPRGAFLDVGNRVPDDEAVVYVGSFQGRGEACWTSAINSINNVVLTLSQTAAHEIGHLVGLYHVEQVDIMNRSATLALLRELSFARGQIQIDRRFDDEVIGEVLTTLIQEPQLYFERVFN